MTLPFSFSLCRQHVYQIVRVTDEELTNAIKVAFEELKLALEPASASTIAALIGPLKKITENKNIGLVMCGANINFDK